MSNRIDPACYTRHLGELWMMEPCVLAGMVEQFRAGVLPEMSAQELAAHPAQTFELVAGGVAVVSIVGPIMKGRSKFGGTSSVEAANAVRAAVADEAVSAILLRIDSPGGMVAGTEHLAHTISQAREVKPVHAHIEDMGASAAYWVASAADFISASPMTKVGSIGTYAVLVDSSEAAEKQGLSVHVIKAGQFKAGGIDGVPITDEDIAERQRHVDESNDEFKSSVAVNRGFTEDQIDTLADGRVHSAKDAVALGLIDKVARADEAFRDIAKAGFDNDAPKRQAARTRSLRIIDLNAQK